MHRRRTPSSVLSLSLCNILIFINMASIDSIIGGIGSGSSVASGAAGLLDSIFGWSAKRQNKYQNQLMDKQFNQQKEFYQMQLEDQLEQWYRENEYNDPTNAYKRLINGLERNGLNKALAIGGAGSGVTASSGHNPSVPAGGSSGLGSSTLLPMGSVSALANLRQRAEISNIEADTEKTRKEAGLVDVQTTNEMLRSSVIDAQHTLLQLSAKNIQADTAVKRATESFTKLQQSRYNELTESQIKQNLSAVVSAMSNYIDSMTKRDLSVAQKSQAYAAARMYVSSDVLNAARVETERRLAEKYGSEAAHNMMDNQLFAMTFSYVADAIRNRSELTGVDLVRARKENKWLHVDKVTQNLENLAKAFYYIATGLNADNSGDSAIPAFINGMNAEDAIGAAGVVF